MFSRREIRQKIGVDAPMFTGSYSPVFQGLRTDHPGGAPSVAARYKGVFRQVEHGKHTLTPYGRELLQEHVGQ